MSNNRELVKTFVDNNPSDISEHLLNIYDTIIERNKIKKVNIIVELGIRYGCSAFATSKAAQDVDAVLIGIDIDDCSSVSKIINWNKWIFLNMDDLEFANIYRERFKDDIDILLIDTNHTFEQTINELKKFVPLMSKKGIIIMHDTNLPTGHVGEAIDIFFDIKGDWKSNFDIVKNVTNNNVSNNNVSNVNIDNARIKNFCNNFGMSFIYL